MNYIGSKHKLNPWIFNHISKTVKSPLHQLVFCDLFSGTGAVAKYFKSHVKNIIANDFEYYSFVLLKNYIENNQSFLYTPLIDHLNQLLPVEGFIFNHYAPSGINKRNYFSDQNAKKIDAIRQEIEQLKNQNDIDDSQYYFLIASLIESADKVANTASVYGAYLKKLKKTALNPLVLAPAHFQETQNNHKVYQEDANILIKKIEGDILYLDPPYNARQYGANYHLLNTIAKYDTFVPKGVTGLRDYQKSNYCKKNEVSIAFDNLIKNARFKYIFMSYNNEGLLSPQSIKDIMSNYGAYELTTKSYQRFKADKTQNRNHKATQTTEYLHILEKQ